MSSAGTPAARIAVVGGGLVGCAAALMAAGQGARVWLIEPQRIPPQTTLSEHLKQWPIRHVAVAPSSLALFRNLGVDAGFPHGAFTRMQVWEEWGTAVLTFTAAELGLPELGRMAELPGLLAALWHRVAQVPDIEVLSGQSVSGLSAGGDDTWILQCGDAQLQVDLVLAADGARSAVREYLGIGAHARATGHHALATVVRTELPHGQVARQRFLLEGPLALLPSRDAQIVSVVWSQSEVSANARLSMSDQAFCQDLASASEGVLGQVLQVGQRAAFPITQQLADSFAPLPGIILVGDAARVLHPLAGLGVNLGLEDVAALETVLASGRSGDWAAWSRQRRARSQLVQNALSALQHTYGQGAPLMSLLRNVGVRWLGRSRFGRRVLAREALGL